MKIGMTYDLREDYLAAGYGEEETAEFDRPSTIAAIEGALVAFGAEVERIGNLFALVAALQQGRRWDLVFNIAEGLYGYGREAAVPALLDAYRIPYTFSDPLTLAVTLHKGMAKSVARDHGVPTPDFTVIESPADIAAVALPTPLFLKPVSEGTGKGVTAASKVTDRRDLAAVAGRLLAQFRQPVLVETFLPGREVTVGVLGTGEAARAIGCLEIILLENSDPDVYTYRNKEICEEVVEYRLATDAVARAAMATAVEAYRALGCRDGGRVDLRCDARGVPQFIEVNPLAGLHPEHSDLCILATKVGMPYNGLIGAIVESALARGGAEKK
ncbi:MAG: ATP-grasp domain-containing protein [Thermodesulfobacteriota bacterium]